MAWLSSSYPFPSHSYFVILNAHAIEDALVTSCTMTTMSLPFSISTCALANSRINRRTSSSATASSRRLAAGCEMGRDSGRKERNECTKETFFVGWTIYCRAQYKVSPIYVDWTGNLFYSTDKNVFVLCCPWFKCINKIK